MLTTREPYVRPTSSRRLHPFVQLDFPEIRRDKFKEGEVLGKEDFARAAVARTPPLAEADALASDELPRDLRLAIDMLVRNGAEIKRMRRERLHELRALARELEPLRATLDRCKIENASLIAARMNVAFLAAATDAMEWPDVEQPFRYVKGFPIVFDINDSRVFRPDEQPAEVSRASFEKNNTRMVSQISREIAESVTSGDADDRLRRTECWNRTKEEIRDGLVGKPRSRAWMDKKHGRGKWRCLGRNAIIQKGKWRCIDNGKRSKHNAATTLHERITCGRADFPVTVARAIAKSMRLHPTIGGVAKRRSFRSRVRAGLRMRHGTNDVGAAYRHAPNSQPEYSNVAVWNDDEKCVSYCELPGHNFGLKSAVVNFNRYPEIATCFARRVLWVLSEHYYDDNDTAEPGWAGDSGQECLEEIFGDRFFGFPFDVGKKARMREANEYLGVVSSFERISEGLLHMDVTQKRRGKIQELVQHALAKRSLPSGIAASLFGKSRFMLSPAYGSLGKACLQPIMQREHRPKEHELNAELEDSLEFIDFVCDHMPPLALQLVPDDARPVVIFTDAEGKRRKGGRAPSGHLGFVAYHPVHGKAWGACKVPESFTALLDKIKMRDTYIGQYELAAAIAVFLSLPAEWMRGRPVELWIDNSGAIGALLRGYSGKPDCARIVNLFHFTVAKLGITSLFIDYVPSESNPADVPSRLHEMTAGQAAEAMRPFGDRITMTVPMFADANGEWLSSTEIASSVWSLDRT